MSRKELDRTLDAVEALLEKDDYEAALRTVQDGLSRLGEDADLLYYKGFLFLTLGRYAEAKEALVRMLQLNPDDPDAPDWLEMAERALGERKPGDPGRDRGYGDRDRRAFDALVERAVSRLPDDLRAALDRIGLIVDDLPQAGLLLSPGEPPLAPDILGLHSGTPLAHHGVLNPVEMPESIYLFRKNILRDCKAEEEVGEQIYTTLLHELGHALGYDEEDLSDRNLD